MLKINNRVLATGFVLAAHIVFVLAIQNMSKPAFTDSLSEAQDLNSANKIDEAIISLNIFISKHPDDRLAYVVRGDVFIHAGDYGNDLLDKRGDDARIISFPISILSLSIQESTPHVAASSSDVALRFR